MQSFWLKFEGARSGCVEAASEEAAAQVAQDILGLSPVSVERIPYPADPRINKYIYEGCGTCPSFCYTPDKCVNKSCCPKNYSCVE